MNTREMIEVMRAFNTGDKIEMSVKGSDNWLVENNPTWDWSTYDYRIKDAMPTINWDHVSDRYRYLYIRNDGTPHICEYHPYRNYHPFCTENPVIDARHFASFKKGKTTGPASVVCRYKDDE